MAKTASLLLLLSLLYIISLVTAARIADTGFIRSSCKSTTYPALCVQSLSAYAASIQQSPRQLAVTALSVSLSRAQSAKSFVTKLRKFRNLKHREYEAIADCLDEMGDTVDRLSKSVQELNHMGRAKGQDFVWHMSNVETWVSAALTDESTCVDGFGGKALEGKVKSSVRAQVVNVAQVTSNALSLINKFSEKH